MAGLIALLLLSGSAAAVSCLDESGVSQEWWAAIKLPKSANAPPVPGKSFVVSRSQYYDQSHTADKVWPNAINNTSFLTKTLAQLNSDLVSVVYYNDEETDDDPDVTNTAYGHTKGILAWTATNAIYIIDSAPKFPALTSDGQVILDVPDNALIYGQNFMCVQLTPTQLFSIAGAMTLNVPDIYYSRIVTSNANITSLLANKQILTTQTSVLSLAFNSGRLKYLNKSAKANIELWEALVGPTLGLSFEVQSWGRPYMPSYCSPPYNYAMLNAAALAIGSYSWKATTDHSKWGVSTAGAWVCFADINRMTSQASRGGGALCFEHSGLHTALLQVITGTQACVSQGY